LRREVVEDILYVYNQHIFIEEFFKWNEYRRIVLNYEKRKCEDHLVRYTKASLLFTLKSLLQKTNPGQLRKVAIGGKIASIGGFTGFFACMFFQMNQIAFVHSLYWASSILMMLLGIQLTILSNYRRKLKKELYQYSRNNQYRIEHIYESEYHQKIQAASLSSKKATLGIRKAS
jgi:hypothetical protein